MSVPDGPNKALSGGVFGAHLARGNQIQADPLTTIGMVLGGALLGNILNKGQIQEEQRWFESGKIVIPVRTSAAGVFLIRQRNFTDEEGIACVDWGQYNTPTGKSISDGIHTMCRDPKNKNMWVKRKMTPIDLDSIVDPKFKRTLGQ